MHLWEGRNYYKDMWASRDKMRKYLRIARRADRRADAIKFRRFLWRVRATENGMNDVRFHWWIPGN